ncbi:aminoacyl-histidine dipeptidase [Lutibacter sp. TH_r2]|uniref:aminoacyl-histidine dipeptidase n=1 Tax=Lutibacter sp. TH_r2 TaxID=3082083 RepID=UPI002954799B|nr:aminoacyl-histidine dipeptidase [Lutibacter sp. TH_r2]MDV7185679.1 aminoacyl-histidine dipeptidase [Lutibacter sp. TH_r2]
MSKEVRNLEPKELWNNFADLNAVPRGSKKEEKVIQFMVDFGNKLNLKTVVDPVGNVIIKKPASKGMENLKTVVMQSHLDMVHQKNSDTNFDFDTEGIKMVIDGDWVKADGTTLGADNGLGVAAIMSVLASSEIKHPAIEALFTIDEETGMTGAMGLQAGYLDGEILLNLDTEEDDEIDIGCAGGVDVSALNSYNEVNAPSNSVSLKIAVTGLNGGHSGMDIDKGLGNANKIMNRILYANQEYIRISEINGGGLRNAIPRESFSKVTVYNSNKTLFERTFKKIAKEIQKEFKTTEPNLEISYERIDDIKKVMTTISQITLLNTVYSAYNGVYTMSPDMENLVETSNNVARVLVKDEKIEIMCLTRSSVESSKVDLANSLKSTFELAGYAVNLSGSYPGWKPNVDSPILKTMTKTYEELFNSKPHVVACHAGLECGILGTNYPEMDMISFGPTIQGAHSPDERANIKSAKKFWKFLLTTLENIPAKK